MSDVKVRRVDEVEGVRKDPPRTSWVLVSEKTVGSQNLSVGMNETLPEGEVPGHSHEDEEEVMFFMSGKGQFVTEDEKIDIRPGTIIYNPPGSTHKILNTGDEVLKFLWIYAPQLDKHRLDD